MNKIIIDGKEYELSAELVEKIKAEVAEQEKVENPFERKTNKRYYYIDSCGCIYSFVDDEGTTSRTLYSSGNYCRDKAIMWQRALHDTLNRLLWRYSEMHGGDNTWDGRNHHHYIYHYADSDELRVTCNDVFHPEGVVYFKEEHIAQKAITEVVKPFLTDHPDFEW